MEIRNVAIVGMGALGLMYGEHMQRAMGKGAVRFVMDAGRCEKHKKDIYTVNGRVAGIRAGGRRAGGARGSGDRRHKIHRA